MTKKYRYYKACKVFFYYSTVKLPSVVATANSDYINAELAKTILEKALSVENAALFIEKNMEFVRPVML